VSGAVLTLVAERTEVARRDAAAHPYRRPFVEHLASAVRSSGRRAIFVEGPRRVGKSIALAQLVDDLLAEGAAAHYCALDDLRIAGTSVRDVVSAIEATIEGRAWLVLDEIHVDPDWSRALKTAVDRGGPLRIIAASSCASVLADGARTDLLGRTERLRAEPMSLPEWRAFRRAHGIPIASSAADRSRELDAYLRCGGFPEHASATDLLRVHRRLREDVADRAIADDVARLLALRNLDGPRRLLDYSIEHSGRRLSKQEAAEVSGGSVPATQSWLRGLLDTGLIWELPPFSSGKRTRAQPKLYAVDPGLVAACARPLAPPTLRGRLMETAVAQALRIHAASQSADLSFYEKSGGGEADFVLETPRGRIVLEVTEGDGSKKTTAAFFKRADTLGAKWAGIATAGLAADSYTSRSSDRPVPIVPIQDLLLALAGEMELPW
jgi:predicted AAA+ superfamily ATPase